VVLDVRTGELLAMTNYPSFNPNNRRSIDSRFIRNRAVTDAFEPGSTLKPFAVIAGLASGAVDMGSMIDTTPGRFRLGSKTIHDHKNFGVISLETLLQKSSNVGVSKVALKTPPQAMWNLLHRVGFGQAAIGAFPGESNGSLSDYTGWRDIDRAAMAYGYGVSVSALQLARAYTIFGDASIIKDISLTKKSYLDSYEGQDPEIQSGTIKQVRTMLESVVKAGGTATHAAVKGYRVAGKTGTVEKLDDNGNYQKGVHRALFAGVAPATNPRLAIVVMVDDPKKKAYFGGAVAAPVFATVMKGALRMYNIAPDDVPVTSTEHLALLQP
jgi:cell division protein FtsI (penicillin-binding protein 3)